MTGDSRPQTEDECPACGGKLIRHEVDIGVGIQYGPWHCMDCVWQEPEVDHGIIDGEDFDPFAAAGESQFSLPGGGRSL